jgi:hypothetical protein
MSQLNLRLDFILLTVLTGPAVLGVYAVASKFAELIRVLGMALQYVFYPKFARETPMRAVDNARRLLPRAGLLSASRTRRKVYRLRREGLSDFEGALRSWLD